MVYVIIAFEKEAKEFFVHFCQRAQKKSIHDNWKNLFKYSWPIFHQLGADLSDLLQNLYQEEEVEIEMHIRKEMALHNL